VDDAVNVRVLLEDIVEVLLVGDVDLVVFWFLAADQLYPVESLERRIVEIVNNDDIVSGFEESKGSERPNVAGATVWLSAIYGEGNQT
jgi:hypothetical protein